MKAYARIQSSMNISVTSGLEYLDVTNPDAHIPDRLKINSKWPTTTVDIKQGSHWYPSEITNWNTVKCLVKDKILTIGEFSDTPDFEQTEVKESKEKLVRNIEKVKKELQPTKKNKKEEIISLDKLSEEEE